jgi:hypothetical protein
VRADRRTRQYTVAAIGCQAVALAIGLLNNLTRWFNDSLTDLSRMISAVGLVLIGAALESIRRLNSRKH